MRDAELCWVICVSVVRDSKAHYTRVYLTTKTSGRRSATGLQIVALTCHPVTSRLALDFRVFLKLKLRGGRSAIGCKPPHRCDIRLLIVGQALFAAENAAYNRLSVMAGRRSDLPSDC